MGPRYSNKRFQKIDGEPLFCTPYPTLSRKLKMALYWLLNEIEISKPQLSGTSSLVRVQHGLKSLSQTMLEKIANICILYAPGPKWSHLSL